MNTPAFKKQCCGEENFAKYWIEHKTALHRVAQCSSVHEARLVVRIVCGYGLFYACGAGNVDVLSEVLSASFRTTVPFLSEDSSFLWPCVDFNQLVICAAHAGSQRCVEYLRENAKCVLDESTCAAAAAGGRLEMLCRLREWGCPWDVKTCIEAAGSSRECLQYALEHGCPHNSELVCRRAAETGSLDRLKCARDAGCPWSSAVLEKAARSGDVLCVRYCLERGLAADHDVLRAGVLSGSVSIVHLLLQNRVCPLYAQLIELAVQVGSCLTVNVLSRSGCPWSCAAYDAAVSRNDAKMLRYLLERGPAPRPKNFATATKHGNLLCLKLLYEARGRAAELQATRRAVSDEPFPPVSTDQSSNGANMCWDASSLVNTVVMRYFDCTEYILRAQPPTLASEVATQLLETIVFAGLVDLARLWKEVYQVPSTSYTARQQLRLYSCAVFSRNLRCLQFVHESVGSWPCDFCSFLETRSWAAEMLEFARQNGAETDTSKRPSENRTIAP